MAIEQDQELDRIYKAIGSRGRFTVLQITLLWIGMLPAGFQLLSNVFIGFPIPHRCASPNNETEFSSTYRDHVNDNLTVVYKQCEIHVVSNGTVINKEKCPFGMEYDLPVDTSFISQFDLVCDSTNLARLTQTCVICGQAFGALLGSFLCDRVGRKPVVVASQIGLMSSGIAIAYSSNIFMFSVFKFVAGGFQQCTMTSVNNMFLELMRIKNRRIAPLLFGLSWLTSVFLMDLIAYSLRGMPWRTIQLTLSLCPLPAFLQICLLRESLRWLLVNRKSREASAYIKSAGRMNGKTRESILQALNLVVAREGGPDTEPNEIKDKDLALDNGSVDTKSVKMSHLVIFRHPRLLVNTLILWIAWFTVSLAYFAIYMSSTSLSGNGYLNFFLTALMEAPACIIYYSILNRLGRKVTIIVTFMIMGVGLIGNGIFRSLQQAALHSGLSLTFNMISMIGASGGFSLVFFYTPELFPTNMRTQAVGMASSISRVGGMLAPFAAVLSDEAKWGPGVLIGCLACLVAILSIFLPETNGRELPQTLEDMKRLLKKNDLNKDVLRERTESNKLSTDDV